MKKKYVRQVILSRRYLDDGFVVIRTREAANLLMKNLNDISNLTMTWQTSPYEAMYLDLRIFKGENFRTYGLLDTGVYTKPISKFLYLLGKSNHPKHITTGIIKGEMIRYLRNTSSERLWTLKTRFLYEKLAERGYSRSQLQEAMQYVSFMERGKYLGDFTPKELSSDAFVVCQYHSQLTKAWKALKKWVNVSQKHPYIRRAWPRMIIYKRGVTIQRKGISAKSS